MQEKGMPEKCNINITGIPNSDSGDNAIVIDNNNSKINYFITAPHQGADMKAGPEITLKLHRDLKMYSLKLGILMAHSHCKQNQIISHARPSYFLRYVAHTLQKLLKEELECLQQLDVITP